ncbi:GNAT family N-acetyltransferase [Haliangium ochraceum]|uniref:GCN5-related N-acetyltransferase n=1 Tax=Haliangium ochraceum (strain DSM 14365 / JCM 11303 / SMP-2) TaxID=502025 RepID=D0LHM0_HALO1|nr:GNAT family N-acetyltransferase [Haliangium ochraceum]ACY12882.1 GCN5-related N-acetyltransferase [Haliangium ochraceum DSM 14365]
MTQDASTRDPAPTRSPAAAPTAPTAPAGPTAPRWRLDGDTELRTLVEDDADELFALVEANRERLRAWLSWLDEHRSVDDILTLIGHYQREYTRGRSLRLAIVHRGALAGMAGLHRVSASDRTAALGYWLGAAFEGRGLVTRALVPLIRHGIEALGLGRIELAAATGNRRSIAVAERLGMHFEGTLRRREWLYDHHVDHAVYSLVPGDRLP